MSLEKLDVSALKKSGYMKQRQKDLFVVRLRMPCGNVTSEQLLGISGKSSGIFSLLSEPRRRRGEAPQMPHHQ